MTYNAHSQLHILILGHFRRIALIKIIFSSYNSSSVSNKLFKNPLLRPPFKSNFFWLAAPYKQKPWSVVGWGFCDPEMTILRMSSLFDITQSWEFKKTCQKPSIYNKKLRLYREAYMNIHHCNSVYLTDTKENHNRSSLSKINKCLSSFKHFKFVNSIWEQFPACLSVAIKDLHAWVCAVHGSGSGSNTVVSYFWVHTP